MDSKEEKIKDEACPKPIKPENQKAEKQNFK